MISQLRCAGRFVTIIVLLLLSMQDAMPRYPDRTTGICPDISVIQTAVVHNVNFDPVHNKYIASAIVDAGYEGFVKRDWMLAIELNREYAQTPTIEQVHQLLQTIKIKHSEKVIYEPGSPPECRYSGDDIVVHAAIY